MRAAICALLLLSDAAWAAPAPIVLGGRGFTVGSGDARIGVTGEAQALALATRALGRPVRSGSHGDCGQGDVIDYALFRSGIELSFVRGRLSGWTADAVGPRTGRGIAVGASVAALRSAYPDVETYAGDEAEGGLGPNFQREGGPNGWLSGTRATDRVTGLYAGATCIAG